MPAVVVFLWLPALLWLDRTASLTEQRLLGLLTWVLLVLLLRRETPLVRMQTVVVIVFATAVEYTFAGLARRVRLSPRQRPLVRAAGTRHGLSGRPCVGAKRLRPQRTSGA